MMYKMLYAKAKHIDHLIDEYGRIGLANSNLLEETKNIVLDIFPDSTIEGSGSHKMAFGIQYNDAMLILKVGKHESIEKDRKLYKRLPKRIRQRYCAKIFWHTKCCSLQECGQTVEVSEEQLENLKSILSNYDLIDIKRDNIKSIDGQLKIIDANMTEGSLSGIFKLADIIKSRLEVIRYKLSVLINKN